MPTCSTAVTLPACDAVSRQPELKHCAVRISRAALPWRLVAFGYPEDADALQLFESLQPLLTGFAFSSCVLLGREREGVLLRASAESPADSALIAAIDGHFGLTSTGTLSYDDARRGVGRRVRLVRGRIEGARLCGQTAGEDWLKELFEQQADAGELGRLLLLPDARPPAGLKPRGRVVCNCWNVAENEILAFARQCGGTPEHALGAVQETFKCGTQCGSCLPEIRRIAAATRARQVA